MNLAQLIFDLKVKALIGTTFKLKKVLDKAD